MRNNFKFNQQEKERIEGAIKALESESSGELVLYFAKRSDSYMEACWKSAAILGGAVSLLIAALSYNWLLPSFITPLIIGLTITSIMILGGVIPFLIPKLRLAYIGDRKVEQRVETKAHEVFIHEEIFNTRDRTGILIYISKFEHMIEVLGDSGINSKIEQKDWDYTVGLILNGIKNNKTADGLVQAIDNCKKLLLDNGFMVREDDTNELKDEIRVE